MRSNYQTKSNKLSTDSKSQLDFGSTAQASNSDLINNNNNNDNQNNNSASIIMVQALNTTRISIDEEANFNEDVIVSDSDVLNTQENKVYKEASLEVKNDIARKILSGKYTQKKLAAEFNVSKSVIGRISKNVVMYLQQDDLDGKKKRIGKASENKELNELIMNKIHELRSKAVCITKTMI